MWEFLSHSQHLSFLNHLRRLPGGLLRGPQGEVEYEVGLPQAERGPLGHPAIPGCPFLVLRLVALVDDHLVPVLLLAQPGVHPVLLRIGVDVGKIRCSISSRRHI